MIADTRFLPGTELQRHESGNVGKHLGPAWGSDAQLAIRRVPYTRMNPDMIASMDLVGELTGDWEGPL